MSHKITEYVQFQKLKRLFPIQLEGIDPKGLTMRLWRNCNMIVLLKFYKNKMWNYWVIDLNSTDKLPRVYRDFRDMIEESGNL